MLTYEFDLMNTRGRRSLICVTECSNDHDAVSRALAMLASVYGRVKVWRGDTMIHDEARGLPN